MLVIKEKLLKILEIAKQLLSNSKLNLLSNPNVNPKNGVANSKKRAPTEW